MSGGRKSSQEAKMALISAGMNFCARKSSTQESESKISFYDCRKYFGGDECPPLAASSSSSAPQSFRRGNSLPRRQLSRYISFYKQLHFSHTSATRYDAMVVCNVWAIMDLVRLPPPLRCNVRAIH